MRMETSSFVTTVTAGKKPILFLDSTGTPPNSPLLDRVDLQSEERLGVGVVGVGGTHPVHTPSLRNNKCDFVRSINVEPRSCESPSIVVTAAPSLIPYPPSQPMLMNHTSAASGGVLTTTRGDSLTAKESLQKSHHLQELHCSNHLISQSQPSQPEIDEEEPTTQQKVIQLQKCIYQGIQSQLKWRMSCTNGTARFSFTCECDEPTFRAFWKHSPSHSNSKKCPAALLLASTKRSTLPSSFSSSHYSSVGGKISADWFQREILGRTLLVRVRYGYLSLDREVKVHFSKANHQIKITGAYGV